MTVAPPRISVAPSQPPPPPVPEVARTGNLPAAASRPDLPAVRRSNTAPGSSLVDATAHLFATPDAPLVRRYTDPGGPPMSASSQPPSSGHLQIRRALDTYQPSGDVSDPILGDGSNQLTDSLVDKVVERIERRVIEELERRGRRHGRGGF